MLLTGCSKKSVMEKIGDYMDERECDTIILSDFTDFEWDSVFINNSLKGGSLSLFEDLGIDCNNLRKSDYLNSGKGTESAAIVYFINKKSAVYVDIVPAKGCGIDVRDKFLFRLPSPNYYVFIPKDKAIFEIINRNTLILRE